MKKTHASGKLSVFAVGVAAVMAMGAITAGEGRLGAPHSRSTTMEKMRADGGAPPPTMPVKKPGSGSTTA